MRSCGADLDQDADSTNSRLSVARYEAEAPFSWIRSFPPRPSTSSVHSGTDCTCGVTNSTKAGCCRTAPVAGMRRFRSSHATCNSRAVRLIPSFRATSTAADQKLSGYSRFPPTIGSPFFETHSCFFKADDGGFASRHGLPPRRKTQRKNDLNSYRPNTSYTLAENSRSSVFLLSLRRWSYKGQHSRSLYSVNECS